MKNIYKHTERIFEKIASVTVSVLSNSVTFVIALLTVIFWFTNRQFYTQGIHESIGNIILGITFLSLFVIQRTFSRFSASLHLKLNELISSHEPANNSVIFAEEKTVQDLTELSKEYAELAEQAKEDRNVNV